VALGLLTLAASLFLLIGVFSQFAKMEEISEPISYIVLSTIIVILNVCMSVWLFLKRSR